VVDGRDPGPDAVVAVSAFAPGMNAACVAMGLLYLRLWR
jgi:hypothetical protein